MSRQNSEIDAWKEINERLRDWAPKICDPAWALEMVMVICVVGLVAMGIILALKL